MGKEKPHLDMAFPISLFYYEYFLSFKDIPFNIYNVPDESVISCGVANKSYINFDEFDVNTKPGKLIDVKRHDYKANLEYCCFNYFNHRYLTDFSKTLTDDDAGTSQYDTSTGNLYAQTCNTDTHFQAFECTDIYKKNCITDYLLTNYVKDDDKYNNCSTWIYNLGNRYSNTFIEIHHKLYDLCKNDLNNYVFCDLYLQGLRVNGNADLQVYADSMIYSQTNKTNFKCAFPPNYILEEASKYNTPYECWYKPCITEPSSHLLYKNLVNQQKCRVTNCDIEISNFNLSNDSDINITCNSKSNVDKKKFKETIDKESNFTLFPCLNHVFFIIIFLIFVIIFNLYNPY